MDCVTAQGLVSAAMDREPVEAALLAEAKEHCGTCAECGGFVRSQLAVRQAGLPTPPADLADRAIAAVHAEIVREHDGAAATAAPQVAAVTDAAGNGSAAAGVASAAAKLKPDTPVISLAPKRRRPLPRPWAVGLLSAASLVALLGVSALVVYGVHQMGARGGASGTFATSKAEAPTVDYRPSDMKVTTEMAPSAAPGTNASAGSGAAAIAGQPQDITVGGVVYVYSGPSDAATASMSVIGNTTTAFDGAPPATEHSVYQGLSADVVYVQDTSGALHSYNRATRTYLGLTYALMSKELTAYGQWPELPATITKPSADDGSPTFAYDGTDNNNVKVYRLANQSAASGIAVAPKTDATGAAAGDPNWTWWAPVH